MSERSDPTGASPEPIEPIEPIEPTETAPGASPHRSPWQLLRRAAHPGLTRARVLGALLVAALGFALVAQLRQTEEQGLSALRESDLVAILDDVGARRDRLAAEALDLENQRRELTSGVIGSREALEAAQERLDALAVLAGTARAEGTGLQVFVTDPEGKVTAAKLLDLVQELRGAGAEAIQVGNVRVVGSTAFTDVEGGVAVDGTRVTAPFTVLAIGDSQTMATALEIPGGVIASLPDGVRGSVAAKDDVKITALHAVPTPQYARPAATATSSP